MRKRRGAVTVPEKSILSNIKPNMTFRLLLIIFFLVLIALGNLVSVFECLKKNDVYGVILYVFVVLIYIIPAYGIFQLKPWARKIEIILSVISFIFGIIIMLLSSLGIGLLVMTIHGLILAYLLSKECRKAFGL